MAPDVGAVSGVEDSGVDILIVWVYSLYMVVIGTA